jgi:hypothetical protein
MIRERQLRTAVLILGAVTGCASPETPPDPRLLSGVNSSEERCGPAETEFSLVGGPEYVGVIIPASYFANVSGDPDAFARRYGFKAHDSWTPTTADVAAAEAGLRAALTAGILLPQALDPYAQDNNARATVVEDIASKIVRKLPMYRRQYAGVVVDGHRQLLCRAFMPEAQLFRRWQCQYVQGNDFVELLWEIRYDVETKQYEGFAFGE